MPLKLTNRDSFPSNPTTDQVEVVDDVFYQYDGSEWNVVPSGPNEARIIGSPDGPSDIKSSTIPDLQFSGGGGELIISSASVDLSDAFVLVTPYGSTVIDSVDRSASDVTIECEQSQDIRLFGVLIIA